ncbi:DUF952 domain-containing protein [Streptomyces sp. NPDC054887]
MIYHVVTLDEWLADPDRPYAPASLASDGFVHCSADESTTLAVADAYFRDRNGPLMALLIDEDGLDTGVEWEGAGGTPPPGVAPGMAFPHVYGPIRRDAVAGLMEIQRDDEGRALGLAPWS